MSASLLDRIRSFAPRKILAKLESDLRNRLDRPNPVLADWFDFVRGTRIGAMIAVCILAGMSMEQIQAELAELLRT